MSRKIMLFIVIVALVAFVLPRPAHAQAASSTQCAGYWGESYVYVYIPAYDYYQELSCTDWYWLGQPEPGDYEWYDGYGLVPVQPNYWEPTPTPDYTEEDPGLDSNACALLYSIDSSYNSPYCY